MVHMTVLPLSVSLRNVSMMFCAMKESRPVVGSSQNSMDGFVSNCKEEVHYLILHLEWTCLLIWHMGTMNRTAWFSKTNVWVFENWKHAYNTCIYLLLRSGRVIFNLLVWIVSRICVQSWDVFAVFAQGFYGIYIVMILILKVQGALE